MLLDAVDVRDEGWSWWQVDIVVGLNIMLVYLSRNVRKIFPVLLTLVLLLCVALAIRSLAI
jgi:hypothetical protein